MAMTKSPLLAYSQFMLMTVHGKAHIAPVRGPFCGVRRRPPWQQINRDSDNPINFDMESKMDLPVYFYGLSFLFFCPFCRGLLQIYQQV